ncbi:MAG: type IV toxin-antitoxin system AbiEi family antitoxin domain-containing protein [Gemmatimonadota bacterium]|jgi:hypothetical protein
MAAGIEKEIGELARRQHGVVSRSQLMDLGLRPGAIFRRARSGTLRRLHRGVYQVGPILPPGGVEMAAVLACGSATLIADGSAASLWRLILTPGDPAPKPTGRAPKPTGRAPKPTGESFTPSDAAPVHVLRVGGGGHPRPGIRMRRVARLDDRDRTLLEGIPVTTPGRTLLDLAARAGIRELERAVARAERERLVTRDELVARLDHAAGRPGAPALRAVLKLAGGPAVVRSELEGAFLDLAREAGLPPPEANAAVGGYELDFLWRDLGIAVEVDGYRYHGTRSRFEADRRRTTRLAALGIQVIPLTWRQVVDDRLATAVLIGNALLRARLRGQAAGT